MFYHQNRLKTSFYAASRRAAGFINISGFWCAIKKMTKDLKRPRLYPSNSANNIAIMHKLAFIVLASKWAQNLVLRSLWRAAGLINISGIWYAVKKMSTYLKWPRLYLSNSTIAILDFGRGTYLLWSLIREISAQFLCKFESLLLNIKCSMTIVMQGGEGIGMRNFVFQTFEILLPSQ